MGTTLHSMHQTQRVVGDPAGQLSSVTAMDSCLPRNGLAGLTTYRSPRFLGVQMAYCSQGGQVSEEARHDGFDDVGRGD